MPGGHPFCLRASVTQKWNPFKDSHCYLYLSSTIKISFILTYRQLLWQRLSSDSNSDSSSDSGWDLTTALTATLIAALSVANLCQQLGQQLKQQLWQQLWRQLSTESTTTALPVTTLTRTITHQSTSTLSVLFAICACTSGSLALCSSVRAMVLQSVATWSNASAFCFSKSWSSSSTV